jgi:hypothetical protein
LPAGKNKQSMSYIGATLDFLKASLHIGGEFFKKDVQP